MAKGLMVSGIISDTVLFKSATTTADDEAVARRLSSSLGISVEEYGMEILKEKGDISDVSARELLRRDMKEFNFGGHHVAVAQVELIDASLIEPKLGEIIELMGMLAKEGIDLVVFMVTDIIDESSRLYAIGSDYAMERFEKAFNGDISDGYIYGKGIMSRKKQVIPPLQHAFEDIP
ncbi:MAG: DHH family phosphoesterase [Methermicoccaceae archaeon]